MMVEARTIVGVAIAAAIVSCGQKRATDDHALSDGLTDSLTLLAKSADFNGFGVALVGPEGILYQNGFGMADVAKHIPYTANTVQAIASISKTFIGLAVMKAQELGELKLDDPINGHLPFTVVNPHYPDVPITIRHLVTHTSSIVDTDDYLHRSYVLVDTTNLAANLATDLDGIRFCPPGSSFSMENFLRNYLPKNGAWYSDSAFLSTNPGERFAYSNIGATLAALIVEKATGMPFDTFTQQQILEPLGMRGSGWHVEGIRDTSLSVQYQTRTVPYPRYRLITYPDGGFTTCAGDMAKYLAELVKGYRGEGTLLSKAGYAEYFREQLSAANFVDRRKGKFTCEHNMGIFIGFSSEGYVGHTGGDPGTAAFMFIERSTGLGRYLIVNTDMDNLAHFADVWEMLGRYAARMAAE